MGQPHIEHAEQMSYAGTFALRFLHKIAINGRRTVVCKSIGKPLKLRPKRGSMARAAKNISPHSA